MARRMIFKFFSLKRILLFVASWYLYHHSLIVIKADDRGVFNINRPSYCHCPQRAPIQCDTYAPKILRGATLETFAHKYQYFRMSINMWWLIFLHSKYQHLASNHSIFLYRRIKKILVLYSTSVTNYDALLFVFQSGIAPPSLFMWIIRNRPLLKMFYSYRSSSSH